MYTVEELEKLIPSTYVQYRVTVVSKEGRVLKDREYPTVGEPGTPYPCKCCNKETPNRLGFLFHPILRVVAEYEPGWPHFCDMKCLYQYIVDNQTELLLSITA